MDFTILNHAMASNAYEKIADICDELLLKVAGRGINFRDEWPYTLHLLGHIYVYDLNSARFLWKTIPTTMKASNPEIVAVWKIGQCLWTRDYFEVHKALRGFDWSPEYLGLIKAFSEKYTKKMFQLLVSAYSTIDVSDAARFLGMSDEDVTSYALQHGWTIDPVSQMLTVKKWPVVIEQKLDPSKLQRLTEYVFFLEH